MTSFAIYDRLLYHDTHFYVSDVASSQISGQRLLKEVLVE